MSDDDVEVGWGGLGGVKGGEKAGGRGEEGPRPFRRCGSYFVPIS